MNRISNGLLAGTLAATFVMPALADSPRDEIEAALASFEEAFNKGDATAVGGHYTEDGRSFRRIHRASMAAPESRPFGKAQSLPAHRNLTSRPLK